MKKSIKSILAGTKKTEAVARAVEIVQAPMDTEPTSGRTWDRYAAEYSDDDRDALGRDWGIWIGYAMRHRQTRALCASLLQHGIIEFLERIIPALQRIDDGQRPAFNDLFIIERSEPVFRVFHKALAVAKLDPEYMQAITQYYAGLPAQEWIRKAWEDLTGFGGFVVLNGGSAKLIADTLKNGTKREIDRVKFKKEGWFAILGGATFAFLTLYDTTWRQQMRDAREERLKQGIVVDDGGQFKNRIMWGGKDHVKR